eukprot:scaffold37474_cov19-Prasinocladus_malaysianus.AAC.1
MRVACWLCNDPAAPAVPGLGVRNAVRLAGLPAPPPLCGHRPQAGQAGEIIRRPQWPPSPACLDVCLLSALSSFYGVNFIRWLSSGNAPTLHKLGFL